ncbi:ATP-binding cassette subfamily B protein [Lachnotalea glycerini]|uniref:ABC transporter ATP-binding protein n=1 Tax=Lachnotalea glycerini TaxID=1763509 RepID=A0A255I1N5_9FIRM|nr:ABC transporter ATP-binding protein [Lachnotalea glycerini]PXV93849.1 ATP-binding cassette subfamily B protein [Lachnotalea glycerini]RDY30912.1 ABC transporter ATP-binding protein [Lachnotalea glycerini]
MTKKNSFERYYKYIKPFKTNYIILLSISLILSISTLPVPLLISEIIDNAMNEQKVRSIANIGIIILAIYIVKSILQYYVNKKLAKIGNEVSLSMRSSIIKYINELPINYIERTGIGNLISLIMNDVSVVSNLLTTTMISDLINNTFVMIFIIIVLFLINWKLTLSVLIIGPFYYFISKIFNNKIRNISKKVQSQSANVIIVLTDILSNQKIIRAYNSQHKFEKKFTDTLRKLTNLHNEANALSFIVQQLTFFFVNVSPLIVFWYGIYLVTNGEISIGILVAFYQYVIQAYSPFRIFMNFNIQFQSAYGALSRIDELFNLPLEFNFEEPEIRNQIQGDVKFKDINFSYEEKYTLKNINFSIRKGEFVAIVGPSGSGKTTITNLIMRFYEPNEGNIYFNNVNSRNIHKKYLRNQIGIVTQEPYLFNATIEENILLSKPDATKEEIIGAAKMAKIHDYIENLKQGYDTIVNERGTNLSGGQKQRIALARVFLQKPKIVIFDEATSSLDSNLEKIIHETLFKLSGNSTCIVVSHRIASVSAADQILVIDKGQVVESGKHIELMNNQGLYYELYNKQIKGDR